MRVRRCRGSRNANVRCSNGICRPRMCAARRDFRRPTRMSADPNGFPGSGCPLIDANSPGLACLHAWRISTGPRMSAGPSDRAGPERFADGWNPPARASARMHAGPKRVVGPRDLRHAREEQVHCRSRRRMMVVVTRKLKGLGALCVPGRERLAPVARRRALTRVAVLDGKLHASANAGSAFLTARAAVCAWRFRTRARAGRAHSPNSMT